MYGNDLDFDEYYRKFVQRNVSLPFPQEKGIRDLVSSFAATILEVTSDDFKRSSGWQFRHHIDDIVKIVNHLRLTPRQLHEVFRLIGHALACEAEEREKLRWCYGAASLLLGTLSVGNPSLYHMIGRGTATRGDLLALVKLFGDTKSKQWWAGVIVTGYATDDKEYQDLINEFIAAGILSKETGEKGNQTLSQFAAEWGWHRTQPGLQFTYDVIEGVKRFSDPG